MKTILFTMIATITTCTAYGQSKETFEEYIRGSYFSSAEFGFGKADRYARTKAVEFLAEWKKFITKKVKHSKDVSITFKCDGLTDASAGRDGAQYETRCDVTITYQGELKTYVSQTYCAAYPKGPITTFCYDFVENT